MLTLKQKLTNYFNDDENASYFMDEYCDDPSFDDTFPEVERVCLDSYGGEDMGSDYWAVWKFTEGEESVMYRFQGYYASHYGTDYQDYQEVQPKQKEITVYE
jgi:hypothetical protein